MAVTDKDVLAIMRTERRPLKARRIAYILRTETGNEVTRTEVNRILYALKLRGLASIDSEHLWTLTGEARFGIDDHSPKSAA